MHGFLLAIQFFTILPIRKELPMGRNQVTMMFASLPVIGICLGMMTGIVYTVSTKGFTFSPLFTAILLVLTGLILTGGLHLDGWADTADAFFSYQAVDKRQTILEDPRLGAFGAMALIVLLLLKIGVVYESLLRDVPVLLLLLFIPSITRASFTMLFVVTPAAKETGIGAFFKARVNERLLIGLASGWMIVLLVIGGLQTGHLMAMLVLFLVLLLSIVLVRSWAVKQFGGMSGDLSGTYIEGMEVVIWLLLLGLL